MLESLARCILLLLLIHLRVPHRDHLGHFASTSRELSYDNLSARAIFINWLFSNLHRFLCFVILKHVLLGLFWRILILITIIIVFIYCRCLSYDLHCDISIFLNVVLFLLLCIPQICRLLWDDFICQFNELLYILKIDWINSFKYIDIY